MDFFGFNANELAFEQLVFGLERLSKEENPEFFELSIFIVVSLPLSSFFSVHQPTLSYFFSTASECSTSRRKTIITFLFFTRLLSLSPRSDTFEQ
jgi:hypothetical protein